MNPLLVSYAVLVRGVREAVFVAAVFVAVVAVLDWLVRTRRISPFSGIARFFRRSIDPLLVPVERTVIRAGGQPSAAPWWSLVAVVVGGVVLILLLDFLGRLLQQLVNGLEAPRLLPIIFLSWAFKLVELALIVRVLSSWLPISPHSRWIRWSYSLTTWILVPLRRIIPLVGMIDISPIVAYLLLTWILEPMFIGILRSALAI